MSRPFFTALGRSLMRKHAARIPWPSVVQALRKRELLPGVVPRLPFLEPDEPELPATPPVEAPAEPPEIPPELLAELLRQEQLPVPLSLPTEKEQSTPEPQPELKSEGAVKVTEPR